MCDGQITLPIAIVSVGILLFIYGIARLIIGFFMAKYILKDFNDHV